MLGSDWNQIAHVNTGFVIGLSEGWGDDKIFSYHRDTQIVTIVKRLDV